VLLSNLHLLLMNYREREDTIVQYICDSLSLSMHGEKDKPKHSAVATLSSPPLRSSWL